MVNPEREPGDDDDHHGGEVDRDDVEGELPGKQEVHLHNRAVTETSRSITVPGEGPYQPSTYDV